MGDVDEDEDGIGLLRVNSKAPLLSKSIDKSRNI